MILLTGATGFVGSHLLSYLQSQKKTVRVLGRQKPEDVFPENFFQADLTQSNSYTAALNGIEVVVHCAARAHIMNDKTKNPLVEFRRQNTESTLHLAHQAAKAGVKRFIFISSIKVNGEESLKGQAFSATDTPKPEDAYGQSKAEAEKQLLDLASDGEMEIVIIRPPLIYGPGVKANFALLIKLLSLRVLPLKSITNNKRSLVSIYNLTNFIACCLNHPNAANKIFMVSDDEDVSTVELLQHLSEATGRRCILLPFPESLFRALGKLLGKSNMIDRLCGSLQVDISETKRSLHWSPPYTVSEGMKKSFSSSK